jgi:hypothetical protein
MPKMELTIGVGTCTREGTEASTVVVTTTRGPWEGVTVIITTLLLATGLLLLIGATVVLAKPLESEESQVEVDVVAETVCNVVPGLSLGSIYDEDEEEDELTTVERGAVVSSMDPVVFEGNGNGANGMMS